MRTAPQDRPGWFLLRTRRRASTLALALFLAVAAGCARAAHPPAEAPRPPSEARQVDEFRPPADFPLRYDGLYRSENPTLVVNGSTSDLVWNYLRFYPEGTVIGTAQTGMPPHPLRYFQITDERLPSGTVTLRDGVLSFSTREPGRPAVDYVGEVRGDRLHLRIHSHINGYRAETVYVFVPGLPEPFPRPPVQPRSQPPR
jgi:hypothetical protein